MRCMVPFVVVSEIRAHACDALLSCCIASVNRSAGALASLSVGVRKGDNSTCLVACCRQHHHLPPVCVQVQAAAAAGVVVVHGWVIE